MTTGLGKDKWPTLRPSTIMYWTVYGATETTWWWRGLGADVTQAGEMWGGEPLCTEEAVEGFRCKHSLPSKWREWQANSVFYVSFKTNQRNRETSLIYGKSKIDCVSPSTAVKVSLKIGNMGKRNIFKLLSLLGLLKFIFHWDLRVCWVSGKYSILFLKRIIWCYFQYCQHYWFTFFIIYSQDY